MLLTGQGGMFPVQNPGQTLSVAPSGKVNHLSEKSSAGGPIGTAGNGS